MSFLKQQLADASNEDSGGSPAATIKSENDSDVTSRTVKTESGENIGEGTNSYGNLHSTFETSGTPENVNHSNFKTSSLKSSILLDDANFDNSYPTVGTFFPDNDVKKPQVITRELVGYHPEDVIVKKADKDCVSAEEMSYLYSEDVLDCKNSNYSNLDIAFKTENNCEGKHNSASALTSFHPEGLPDHKSLIQNAEENQIVLYSRDAVIDQNLSDSNHSDAEIEADEERGCLQLTVGEQIHHYSENESGNSGSDAEEKPVPSSSSIIEGCNGFSHTSKTIEPKKEDEERKIFLNESDHHYPSDSSLHRGQTDCDDKTLLQTIKDEVPDNVGSSNQPIRSKAKFLKASVRHTNNGMKLKDLRVVLEDLFQSSSLGTVQSIHTNDRTCLCIFCAGSVKVKKEKGFLEISSSAKPNERLIIKENAPCSVPSQPKLITESWNNINKVGDFYVCPQCPSKFRVMKDWAEHLCTVHHDDKPFTCPICRAKFKVFTNLYSHMLVHSNNYRFPCPQCPKMFKRRNELQTHVRLVHLNQKALECPQCPREFWLLRDWAEHLRTVHHDDRPFTCTICFAKFKTCNNLNRHKRTHSNNRPFSCPECPKMFKRKAHLQGHIKLHGDQKPFVCPQCPATFKQKVSLAAHLARHSKEKKFSCEHCPMKFSVKDDLRRHLAIHSHKKPFVCSQCPSAFKRKSNWRIHEKKHKREIIYSCAHCSMRTKEKQSLKGHMRIHFSERQFSCKKCPKKFFTAYNLKVHITSAHSDIKSLSCAICQFKCKMIGQMKAHMRIHTGEKPFNCKHCPSKFRRTHHLTAHVARWHSGNSPLYTCKHCPRKYFLETMLNQHMKTHTVEKKFSCEVCFAQFSFKNCLRQHLKTVHTTAKPFSCPICPIKFKTKNSAEAHLKRHSKEKTFVCSQCPAKFVSPYGLKIHSVSVHMEERPYVCAHCSANFKFKTTLKGHIKTHFNVYPFLCKRCPSKFKTKGQLKQHSFRHTKKKKFVCELCEAKFKTKTEIKQHLVSHQNERPYSCSVCSARYKIKAGLNKHMKKHNIKL